MPDFKPQRLTRQELLEYALTGARTELGTGLGYISEEEEAQLRADIEKLERKIQHEKSK